MNVTELTRDQLEYLKECLYYDSDIVPIVPELTPELRKAIDKAQIPEEIPNALVFEIFSGIDFVEDDFPTSQIPKVTIVVADGLIQEIYSTEGAEVEIIDFDTQDSEEYEDNRKALAKIKTEQKRVY